MSTTTTTTVASANAKFPYHGLSFWEVPLYMHQAIHENGLLLPVFAWFIFFWVLFYGLDLLMRVFPLYHLFGGKHYVKLGKNDSLDWRSRFLSSLHAIVAVVGFALTVWRYHGPNADPSIDPDLLVTASDPVIDFFLQFSLGYLYYDTLCMLLYVGTPLYGHLILFHHIISILGVGGALAYRSGGYYCMILLGTELSTPFINNAFFIKACNKGEHFISLLNGACVVLLWLAVRVLGLNGYFLWVAFGNGGKTREALHANTHPFLSFLLLHNVVALSLMNLYWFSLIINEVLKVLFTPKKQLDMEEKKTS